MTDIADIRAELDTFWCAEDKARYFYEAGYAGRPDLAELTAELANPAGGEFQQLIAMVHTEDLRRYRWNYLTLAEALKVYRAIAFCMQRFAKPMTAHVIIMWKDYGLHDQIAAAEALSEYVNRARKWARHPSRGFEFRYVYVHEMERSKGFHTHLLATVPYKHMKLFREWTKTSLAGLGPQPGSVGSFMVRGQNKRPKAPAERAWWWCRYILKQLDPAAEFKDIYKRVRPARDALGVWPARAKAKVYCPQLVGGSQDIWVRAQKACGFLSELDAGFQNIYTTEHLRIGIETRNNERGYSIINEDTEHEWELPFA